MAFASIVDLMVDRLHVQGHAVIADALPPAEIDALRAHARDLDAAGALVPAHTGRDVAARSRHGGARGDRIGWLDATAAIPAEQCILDLVADLRAACNRSLYLGIAAHELHYAIYPPGARYVRHRDRFRDDDARVVSFVLYLNDAWQEADGGALRLYLHTSNPGAHTSPVGTGTAGSHAPCHLDVVPCGGTLVTFLSATIEHEVLPATRERFSLTGWLRRRARI